jgi:hypothetical protein
MWHAYFIVVDKRDNTYIEMMELTNNKGIEMDWKIHNI